MSESFDGWTFEDLGNTYVKLDRVETGLRAQAKDVPNGALDGWIKGVADLKRQIMEKIKSLPGGEFINPEMLKLDLDQSMARPADDDKSGQLARLVAEVAGPPLWTRGLDSEQIISGYESSLASLDNTWQLAGFKPAGEQWTDILLTEYRAGPVPDLPSPAPPPLGIPSLPVTDVALHRAPPVADTTPLEFDPTIPPTSEAASLPGSPRPPLSFDPAIPPTSVSRAVADRLNESSPPRSAVLPPPAPQTTRPVASTLNSSEILDYSRSRSPAGGLHWQMVLLGITATLFVAIAGYCAFLNDDGGGETTDLPLLTESQNGNAGGTTGGTGQPASTQPVLLTEDQLKGLVITSNELGGFFAPCAYELRTNNGTDATQAVSASPQLVQTVRATNLRALYNSAAATAPCSTATVQSLVSTADVATVQSLYGSFVDVYSTLFTGVKPLGPVGGSWDASYCQDGLFASNNTRWLACFMRKSTYFGTILVGFPPPANVPAGQSINADASLAKMKAFATRLEGSLAATYTAQGSTGGGAAPATNYATEIKGALAEYEQAVHDGNGAYFVGHLFPMVLSFYSQATCEEFYSRLGKDPTFKIEVVSVSPPGSWTFRIYNQEVATVPDAYALQVKLTQQGQTMDATVHMGWDPLRKRLLIASPCIRAPQ